MLGRGPMRTEFWWGNVTVRDYFENLGVDRKIILNWIFKK
jgi:hypothetical protein